ncbi:hypothetical protein ACFXHA_17060 [Nocardia sp. NPDC059240]|uniref:hypothetical protein n=1 Tax=Nocardia sp. NPDC059240 TaxID=3346786 RepID=UPI0036BBCDE6
MPGRSPLLPRTAAEPTPVDSRPPVPPLDTLTAAALGRRYALAEVLNYTRRFATAYCRAALGASPDADRLATEVSATVATGWPTAHAARRDFLEFLHSTAHRATRLARYETSRPRLPGELTDQQREILTLRVAVGLSPLETAVALGIRVLDVHRDSGRALTRLRRTAHRHTPECAVAC